MRIVKPHPRATVAKWGPIRRTIRFWLLCCSMSFVSGNGSTQRFAANPSLHSLCVAGFFVEPLPWGPGSGAADHARLPRPDSPTYGAPGYGMPSNHRQFMAFFTVFAVLMILLR